MGIYYKGITMDESEDLLRLIRASFSTVEKELGIDPESFPSFSAYCTKQQLNTAISKGTEFIGAYSSEVSDDLKHMTNIRGHLLIGAVGYRVGKGGKAHISKLAVRPLFRHLGVGRQLMFNAECACLNMNCQYIELGYIEDNKRLHMWYQSLGYQTLKSKAYKGTSLNVITAKKAMTHLVDIMDQYNVEHMRLEEGEKNLVQEPCESNVLLIYSQSEVMRKTNTGVLSQQLLPGLLREYVWHRGSDGPLKGFVDQCFGSDIEVLLVYKSAECENVYKPSLEKDQAVIEKHKMTLYIVLDATWQEAQTIFNQSEYLKSLPRIELQTGQKSRYRKRRNQIEDGLCTAEVVEAIVKPYLTIENCLSYATIIDRYIR